MALVVAPERQTRARSPQAAPRPWRGIPSFPAAVQKRRRVIALTITRSRSQPESASLHSSGLLPYMCFRNFAVVGRGEALAPLPGPARAPSGSTTAAATRHEPSRMRPRRASSDACAASRPARCASGASSTSANVSSFRGRSKPSYWVTRCRSWLPSTTTARSPRSCTKRSTSRDLGPRLTRSPTNHRRSCTCVASLRRAALAARRSIPARRRSRNRTWRSRSSRPAADTVSPRRCARRRWRSFRPGRRSCAPTRSTR